MKRRKTIEKNTPGAKFNAPTFSRGGRSVNSGCAAPYSPLCHIALQGLFPPGASVASSNNSSKNRWRENHALETLCTRSMVHSSTARSLSTFNHRDVPQARPTAGPVPSSAANTRAGPDILPASGQQKITSSARSRHLSEINVTISARRSPSPARSATPYGLCTCPAAL